jgi:prophage antirepressor-like protein
LFAGKDVATSLGYAKPQNALATHVDKEDKGTVAIRDTAYDTRVSRFLEGLVIKTQFAG